MTKQDNNEEKKRKVLGLSSNFKIDALSDRKSSPSPSLHSSRGSPVTIITKSQAAQTRDALDAKEGGLTEAERERRLQVLKEARSGVGIAPVVKKAKSKQGNYNGNLVAIFSFSILKECGREN